MGERCISVLTTGSAPQPIPRQTAFALSLVLIAGCHDQPNVLLTSEFWSRRETRQESHNRPTPANLPFHANAQTEVIYVLVLRLDAGHMGRDQAGDRGRMTPARVL
ncbi:hypothetical protein ABZX51_006249 [Aspergillus tubingensis]